MSAERHPSIQYNNYLRNPDTNNDRHLACQLYKFLSSHRLNYGVIEPTLSRNTDSNHVLSFEKIKGF